jgi:DNA-binding response OmpR family regulator
VAGSRTLLIIEDDRELSVSLELLLGKIGYSVQSAKNGQEGLKIWEEEHPRAVLLDINLPDMDGFEVCRHMKEVPSRRYNTAVLFMSGRDESEIRSNGSAVCGDYYIKKPVDPNDLGVDLYTLFERGFDLEPEEVYRLRVTQRIPPNTDLQPFSGAAPESEVEPQPEPLELRSSAPTPRAEPIPARPSSHPSQSSMQLDQVKDLLLALKGSLGRTRDRLSALMTYIDDAKG